MAKKKTTRARITDKQKEKAHQMILEKRTIEEIAEAVGVSTASVSKMKKAMGLTTPRGGKRTTTTAKASNNVSKGDVAIFALRLGGVDKARKALEQIKDNPALEFSAKVGGVDSALEKVAQLEAELKF